MGASLVAIGLAAPGGDRTAWRGRYCGVDAGVRQGWPRCCCCACCSDRRWRVRPGSADPAPRPRRLRAADTAPPQAAAPAPDPAPSTSRPVQGTTPAPAARHVRLRRRPVDDAARRPGLPLRPSAGLASAPLPRRRSTIGSTSSGPRRACDPRARFESAARRQRARRHHVFRRRHPAGPRQSSHSSTPSASARSRARRPSRRRVAASEIGVAGLSLLLLALAGGVLLVMAARFDRGRLGG